MTGRCDYVPNCTTKSRVFTLLLRCFYYYTFTGFLLIYLLLCRLHSRRKSYWVRSQNFEAFSSEPGIDNNYNFISTWITLGSLKTFFISLQRMGFSIIHTNGTSSLNILFNTLLFLHFHPWERHSLFSRFCKKDVEISKTTTCI